MNTQAVMLPRRRRVSDAAGAGLSTGRGPHLSTRGGQFRLIDANGVEKQAGLEVEVIIVDANECESRTYWDDEKGKISDLPPKCFSDNGTGPSTKAIEPQGVTCTSCPKNIRGQTTTFNGYPTTFCEPRKKLVFVLPEDEACVLYELQVPPGSLSNLMAYKGWIKQQGTSHIHGDEYDIADFVTKLSFDPNKQFVMMFEATAHADGERELALIEHIHVNNLSVSVCGRDDVAHDPENIRAMIAARPQEQQHTQQASDQRGAAAPAPAARQFVLPDNRGRALQPEQGAAHPAPRSKAPAKPKGAPAGNVAPFVAPARQPAPQQEVLPPQADANDGVPGFLQRKPDNGGPPAPPTPRFGVGKAPPPPPDVASAVSKAMSLPTRR